MKFMIKSEKAKERKKEAKHTLSYNKNKIKYSFLIVVCVMIGEFHGNESEFELNPPLQGL